MIVAGAERGEARQWYNWTRMRLPLLPRSFAILEDWVNTNPTEIQNMDLFVNPAGGITTSHFYDNISIHPAVKTSLATAVAVANGSSGAGGGIAELAASDNTYYKFFPSTVDLTGTVDFTTNTRWPSIDSFMFNLEHKVARPGLAFEVFFFDYTISDWSDQGGDAASTTDSAESFAVNSGANVYSNKGEMRTRVVFGPINDEI